MKYKVCIDLTRTDEDENVALIESPLFNTEEEANSWVDSLRVYDDVGELNMGLDFIMVQENEKGEIENTWII